jgi:site-specific DNA-methyltransferase (adenine-specific)
LCHVDSHEHQRLPENDLRQLHERVIALLQRPEAAGKSELGCAFGMSKCPPPKRSSLKPYYQDSAVTIYHGDCREIVPQLGKFDLLLTDPPYGIDFAGRPTNYQRFAGMVASDWDKQKPEELFLSSAGIQIVWGGNYFHLPISRGWLGWVKRDAPPSMGTLELAWTNRDENAKYFDQTISATNAERVGHPTQKPLKLFTWCIQMVGDIETILDPYAGSGTTGRAAKDLGRKAVLIELEEKYCAIAAKRMQQEVLPLT